MKKTKTQKGITLIALIITIIVLLILAVVAIRAVKGDEIISYAKNSATKYSAAQTAEQMQLLEYEYELQKAKGETTASKSEYVLQKVYGDKIAIGTEVAYECGVEGYEGKWQVLGVEGGQLMLLSESIGTLTLQGKDGYTNAVSRLNSMCEPYGNGTGAESARSVKVEDINNLTGYNPTKTGNGEVFRKGQAGEYGNVVTYSYKANDLIHYKAANGVEGEVSGKYPFESFDGKVISSEYPNNTVTLTNTYYYYDVETLTEERDWTEGSVGFKEESTIYNLIKNTSAPDAKYWLADTDICTSPSRASWQVRYVWGDTINASTVYHSCDDDDQTPYTYGVRAVVYLEP